MSSRVSKLAESVRKWRAEKSAPTTRMPKELRQSIIDLRNTSDMSDGEIIRSLNLHGNFFKGHKKPTSTREPHSASQFVRLPEVSVQAPQGPAAVLSFEFKNGLTVKVYQ